MKVFPKTKLVAFAVVTVALMGCKKKQASPDLCYDVNFKPVSMQFDFSGGSAGQLAMRIDLKTDKVNMEKNDSSQNVCTYDLTRAEADELISYFEKTATICQGYAEQGGDTQRVLAWKGEQEGESESVGQPDNNVLRIEKGYDQLEGNLLSLADKIKSQGDCTSSSPGASSGTNPGTTPGSGSGSAPGGSIDPGQIGNIPSF